MKETNMATSHMAIAEQLRHAGIRPSAPRVNVLKYLREQDNHPTVDMIYKDLITELPGLSRTSVYNSLGLLEDTGFVRSLAVEGNEMRFDAFIDDHGHFKCEACGAIFDVEADMRSLKVKGMGDFQIKRKDLFLRGLCPTCAQCAPGVRRRRTRQKAEKVEKE